MCRRWWNLLWILPALPALYQVWLLVYTMVARAGYPYDLEWMEGGMLAHALRVSEGQPLYAPPSVEFIPYLYTPLYPTLLAGLGKIFGLSYTLGRVVSVVSTLGVVALAAVATVREAFPATRALAGAAAAAAAGFFAATYPWVEGWYDLVRGDSLFLAMGTLGLVLLRAWARRPSRYLEGFWHPRIAIVAAILALSFFAKQTGVLLVVAGGAALLVLNWRALATYIVVAGAIGGGGSLILKQVTGGWFWIYVFEYHQQHDTNFDRFVKSFGHILWQFPAMTLIIACALVAVVVVTAARGRMPRGAGGFLYWFWLFVVGTFIGALGWATQWAHFNAYIPAMTFGAICAGNAVVALAGCAHEVSGPGVPYPAAWRQVIPALALALLAVNAVEARWQPRRFLPTAADRAAGDRLIQRLRAIDGDVFVPAHPWYSHLAGKRPFVHRMGILDVTHRGGAGKKRLPPRAHVVEGLAQALREGRFGAVVMDDRNQLGELPGLQEGYRLDVRLPGNEILHVVSGAPTVPRTIWRPIRPEAVPPGVSVVFDFDGARWDGWQKTGTAWGGGPVKSASRGGGGVVGGARGRAFASSLTGGEKATGTLLSPPFVAASKRMVILVAGGKDAAALRVELRRAVTGDVLRSATGPKADVMQRVEWDTAELAGSQVQLALVDEATGAWGFLAVDDLWMTE